MHIMVGGMTANLPDATPTEAKNPALVQSMFDRVAPTYDLANTLLTMGSDRHWRQVVVNTIDPKPGMTILDVATGTGRLASALAERGATVVGLDFSAGMLHAGAQERERHGQEPLMLVNGDGNHLPFADNTFDGLTISFGLRNFPDPRGALASFARVVKPGGFVCVLEFSTPTHWLFKGVYETALTKAMPQVAKTFTADPKAYTYLADSIMAWPDQPALARWFKEAGMAHPRWQNLFGGAVAVHMGTVPV